MPDLTRPLSFKGAMLDILVGFGARDLQRLRRASKPIPQPIPLQAMIDTGATYTSIDAGAFRSLGLQPSGYMPISTASASWILREQFDVCLTIVHPSGNSGLDLVLKWFSVTHADLLQTGIPALIGCDLLDRCVFTYDGPARTFTLRY
jgi:hypothetical protein